MAGARVEVVRNDAVSLEDVRRLAPDAIVVSPGPCTPAQAGISNCMVRTFSGRIPILGVCLGHQCIGEIFGGRVARARQPMHGLESDIAHGGKRLFAGLPSPLQVGRYHSLVVEPTPLMDDCLTVDATSPEGEIMALSHRSHPTWGVQFHPESVLTPAGEAIFANFLSMAATFRREREGSCMFWLDGTLYPTSRVSFDVADRGLLLGDGVFDTSLVLAGTMVWRPAHVARLVAAAATLGLRGRPRPHIAAGIDAVLDQASHGTLRVTVTRGAGPRGLAPPADPKPSILVALAPLRPQALFAPLKLHHDRDPPQRHLAGSADEEPRLPRRRAGQPRGDRGGLRRRAVLRHARAHRLHQRRQHPRPDRRRPDHAAGRTGRSARHRARNSARDLRRPRPRAARARADARPTSSAQTRSSSPTACASSRRCARSAARYACPPVHAPRH